MNFFKLKGTLTLRISTFQNSGILNSFSDSGKLGTDLDVFENF
jgi:hypothetical protein